MTVLNSDLVPLVLFNFLVKQSGCSNFSRGMVALRSIKVAKPNHCIDSVRLLHNDLNEAVFRRLNRDLNA